MKRSPHFRSRLAPRLSNRRPPARSFRPLLEALEDRTLLSNIVWVNRGADGFSTNAATVTTITTGTANDSIDVFSTSSALTINSGPGADTLRLGGPFVDGIRGPLTIDAGTNPAGAADSLILQEFQPPGFTNVGFLGNPPNAGLGRGFLGGVGMGDRMTM